MLRHAAQRPDDPAVGDDNESLTYGELMARTRALASGLRAAGVGPGDRVALYLGNSAAFVTSALACLWTGAPFVPLSVDDPPARVANLVEDCDARLVITREEGPILEVGAATSITARDLGPARDAATSAQDQAPATSPDRDAYIVYTSGTTGTPKGVRISRRAFRASLERTVDILPLDHATRSLCVSAFHFDGSFGAVFPTLVAGGALVIPKREELLFIKRFFSSVRADGITHTSFSPSYLRLLISARQLPSLAGSKLASLTIGGSEGVATDLAKLWEALPNLRVFNRYGPTEATMAVSTYEVEHADAKVGSVPIGIPHAGTEFFIIGDDGARVSGHGEVGELYIAGEQLMQGYFGDEQLSREVLRQDVVPGRTVYKTGDLVYRDERGRYVYAGRTNDVIKRNGTRISLREVARAFECAEGVAAALASW